MKSSGSLAHKGPELFLCLLLDFPLVPATIYLKPQMGMLPPSQKRKGKWQRSTASLVSTYLKRLQRPTRFSAVEKAIVDPTEGGTSLGSLSSVVARNSCFKRRGKTSWRISCPETQLPNPQETGIDGLAVTTRSDQYFDNHTQARVHARVQSFSRLALAARRKRNDEM